MSNIYKGTLGLVGNTPLVDIKNITLVIAPNAVAKT